MTAYRAVCQWFNGFLPEFRLICRRLISVRSEAVLASTCGSRVRIQQGGRCLCPFRCPLGPLLGPLIPADSGIIRRQERQIVRSTSDLHGFLPGFGQSSRRMGFRGSRHSTFLVYVLSSVEPTSAAVGVHFGVHFSLARVSGTQGASGRNSEWLRYFLSKRVYIRRALGGGVMV